MAAIDKTYVTKDELIEAIDWAKKVGRVTAENGHKFRPLTFIRNYNQIDDPNYFDEEREEYVLWNTPTWFDRWLWNNCPLDFVRERLKIQYSLEYCKSVFENFKFDDPKNRLEKGHQHYTFLEVPKFRYYKWYMRHGRKDNPWPDKKGMLTYLMEIIAPNDEYEKDLEYDKQTDAWYNRSDNVPAYGEYIWQYYHKNPPTKKAIIRELRRWYIPKGYIVRIYQLKYDIGIDFKILVK